ncbi:unnamed protein product [Discosporangium mesarthrocarpum]
MNEGGVCHVPYQAQRLCVTYLHHTIGSGCRECVCLQSCCARFRSESSDLFHLVRSEVDEIMLLASWRFCSYAVLRLMLTSICTFSHRSYVQQAQVFFSEPKAFWAPSGVR